MKLKISFFLSFICIKYYEKINPISEFQRYKLLMQLLCNFTLNHFINFSESLYKKYEFKTISSKSQSKCNRCVRIVKWIAKGRRFAVCEITNKRVFMYTRAFMNASPRPCTHSNTRLLYTVERMLKIVNLSHSVITSYSKPWFTANDVIKRVLWCGRITSYPYTSSKRPCITIQDTIIPHFYNPHIIVIR